MKKKIMTMGVLLLCMILVACGSNTPSLEEVEAAIEDGSVTVQDALDKGWITQEWADSYLEENSVPAADKIAVNKMGEFVTETKDGDTFANEDMSDVTFLAFIDPADTGAADFYESLTAGIEGVRGEGVDIVVCSKGDMEAELFQDAPFPVVAYNDSLKTALAQNDEMASGSPCVGVWYVNGSLLSAWSTLIDTDDLADSAAGFVAMGQDMDESPEDGSAPVAMG